MKNKKKDEQTATIEELENQLKKMLEERPELQALQDEIERITKEAGHDPDKRIKAINEFFVKHVRETFIPEIKKISNASKEVKEQIKLLKENTGAETPNKKKKKILH